MFRPLPLYIGARYTRAKRRNQFISFISLTSMLGLALGVMAMIVVLSVMNGFQQEMSSRILGALPHALIHAERPLTNWPALSKQLQSEPGVLAVAPFAEMDGMLSYRGQMQPIQIQGIDPELEGKVSSVATHITHGRLDQLQPAQFNLVLGELAARRLGLRLGDGLTLIVPEVSANSSAVTPRMYRLTLVGTFKVGADMDDTLGLINISDAARIRHLDGGDVDTLRLKLADLYAAPVLAQRLASKLGAGYSASDWTASQGSLFAAMKMEKTMIALLLLLIIAVAAFNIVAILIMVVADKRTDIAILRTLGASPQQIMATFMVQGTIIGCVGTLLGGLLGVLLALKVSGLVAWVEQAAGRRILTSDIYLVSSLPSKLQAQDVLLVCCAGLALSFLATLYPAWRAAQAQPADALRYE